MRRPEEAVHRAIAAHLRLRLAPPWMYWATANQRGTRKGWEQAILSALGVRPGIPDLFVAGEGRVIGVEVKEPKGTLSPAQKDTIAALGAAGIPTLVVRSVDEAEAALKALGVPLRGRTL